MFARRWALCVFAFLMMTGLSSLNAASLSQARLISNVEYSAVNGTSLRMDASIPQGVTKSPAVIIVHGGGWVAGDRRLNVQPLFKPLSDAGFAWFSISYRLATDLTQFGAAIEDVRSAVRFVKAHAAQYHVDPERIALIGESAGGQLAAMAALQAGRDASVRAVVALYTPTDLVSIMKHSDYVPASVRSAVLGTPWEPVVMASLAQLSPVNHVRRDMPPFLFIHGTDDALVPFEQSRNMCDRMKSAGASCELYAVEGGGHGILWWESIPRLRSAYKHKMIEWLEREIGPTQNGPFENQRHLRASSGFTNRN